MKVFPFVLLIFGITSLLAQQSGWQQATADPMSGKVTIRPLSQNLNSASQRSTLNQLPGWPVTLPVNQYFKPFRGLALADINNDDTLEVIASTASQITAFDHRGNQLWNRYLTNYAQYCPSVADVNNDGWLEIVQTTRGPTSGGRVYLLDHLGNDLAGWPVNLSNQNIAGAACLADVDGDTLMEIIVGARDYPIGHLHVLKLDGSTFSGNWPVDLDHVPAVTAAVGDVDNDNQSEIVYCSYNSIYVLNLNGQLESGWPVTPGTSNFSYQSPLLADINGDNYLEILTATSGNAPALLIYDYLGQPLANWPKPFPGWSYCPPTAVNMNQNGTWNIFAGCQGGLVPAAVLFAYDLAGTSLPNFPIVKPGGAEGFISITDVDGDGTMEVLADDNLTDGEGNGFLHAFKLDGSGEAPGFPLQPTGFTYLNGAELGDIDNDGQLDVATVSFNDQSTYVNVWPLGVAYQPEKVLFGTYHGNVARTGWNPPLPPTAIQQKPGAEVLTAASLEIFPNPMNATAVVQINLSRSTRAVVELYDLSGRKVRSLFTGHLNSGSHRFRVEAGNLGSGIYFVHLKSGNQLNRLAKLVLIK